MLPDGRLAKLTATPFVPSAQTLYYVGWRSFHHRGYVIAYLREEDVVGVIDYKTCSCNDTDELFEEATWGNANWTYIGRADDLYSLCREHRDLKLPSRQVHEDDFDCKWILKLQDVFVEWIDAGKPQWEKEDPKRAFNAIRGGKVDGMTEPAGAGDNDMASFVRDPAIRDWDKANAVSFIERMGGQANIIVDGEEVRVSLSAGNVYEEGRA